MTQIYCPTLNLPSTLKLTISHEQFVQLAWVNQNLQLERTATGELIVMPPTGSDTGNKNADILGQLWLWNRQTQLGQIFDSSSGFHLPNGADRSPDVSWIGQDQVVDFVLLNQRLVASLAGCFMTFVGSDISSLLSFWGELFSVWLSGAGIFEYLYSILSFEFLKL